MLALTHRPSRSIGHCELTHVPRAPIDQALAEDQHRGYCQALERFGATVRVLDVNQELPDSVFIEDTAVVLDEVAMIMPMGTESRRREPPAIEFELRRHREVERIVWPALIEGGDVLRIGRKIIVGISSRTNMAGIQALSSVVERFGYTVIPVSVFGCLHLKTACCAIDETRLFVNDAWIDPSPLTDFELIPVAPDEPWSANLARLGPGRLMAAAYPKAADTVRSLGHEVVVVDISEYGKAEGGVTCLSLLVEETASG